MPPMSGTADPEKMLPLAALMLPAPPPVEAADQAPLWLEPSHTG